MLHEADRLEEALDFFSKAIEIDPSMAEARAGRASVHISMQSWDMAVEDATRALKLDPQDASSFYYRGNAYWALGRDIDAVRECTSALQLAPHLTEASCCRAACHLRLGEFDACVKDYDRAISTNPRDIRSLYGRGYARCMQQEWAAAVEDLERACKIEPAFATASETLAKARVQLKAAELRAAKAMDELLQGNPAKAAAGGDRAEGGGGGEIGDKKNKKKNKKNKKDKKNKKKSKNLSAAVDGDSGDEEGRGAGGGREERITSHPGLEDNEILTAGVLNTVLTSPTEIPLPQAELSMSTTAVGMLSSTTTEPVAKKQPASPSDSNAPQSSNRASPPVPTAVLFVTKPQPLKTSTPLSPSAPVFSPASKKARASSAPEFPSGGSLATTTTKAVVAGDHHESDADAMGLRVGDKSATYATTISAMNSAGTGLTFSPTQQLADMAAAPASVKTTSDVTAAATATIAATIAAIAMANSTAVDVATSTVASQGGADDSYLKVASEAGETAGSELVSALDVPVNRHAPIRTASLPNPPNLDAYVPLHMNPSPKRGRRVGRRHTHSMGSERPGSLEHWVKQQEEQSRARVISKDDNLVWTNPDAYVPLHMGPLVPSKIKGRRKSKTKTSISSERKNHSTTGTDAADGSTPRPRRNHTRRNDETDADNTVTGKHREPGRRRLRKMWGGTSGKRVNKSLDDDLLKIEAQAMVQASLGVGLAMVLGTTTGKTDNWVSEELCMAATTKLGNEYKGSLMEQMQSEYVSAYVRKGLEDTSKYVVEKVDTTRLPPAVANTATVTTTSPSIPDEGA